MFAWLASAHNRAALLSVNISIEHQGIAIWADGEWTLRTWAMLDEAKTDPLTPTVNAIAARVARKRAAA